MFVLLCKTIHSGVLNDCEQVHRCLQSTHACTLYLRLEEGLGRDGQEAAGCDVQVHQNLTECRTILGLLLPV